MHLDGEECGACSSATITHFFTIETIAAAKKKNVFFEIRNFSSSAVVNVLQHLSTDSIPPSPRSAKVQTTSAGIIGLHPKVGGKLKIVLGSKKRKFLKLFFEREFLKIFVNGSF